MRSFALKFRKFIDQPLKVLAVCLFFLLSSFVFDGILWRLWGLSRDQSRLENQTKEIQQEIVLLHKQLKQAKDPVYIERQARDRLDLVADNDLVFVFPEE